MPLPHTLGSRSQTVYDTLHNDLKILIDWTLNNCDLDFTLTEGHRSIEKQLEYYSRGRIRENNGSWTVVDKKKIITYVDGVIKKGKHNYNPSLAFDFCVHVQGKPQLTWDKEHLVYIAASFGAAGTYLFNESLISHKVKWGGNWNKDEDLTNQRFFDLPHIELYT